MKEGERRPAPRDLYRGLSAQHIHGSGIQKGHRPIRTVVPQGKTVGAFHSDRRRSCEEHYRFLVEAVEAHGDPGRHSKLRRPFCNTFCYTSEDNQNKANNEQKKSPVFTGFQSLNTGKEKVEKKWE